MRKSYLGKTIFILILFSLCVSFYLFNKNDKKEELSEDIHYVSSSIFDRSIPVINNDYDVIGVPYSGSNVKIGRYFYNKNDSDDRKMDSIVVFKNTYMMNTGVDYVDNDVFNVINIYEGTVVDVKKDDLVGESVTVRHNGDLISVYSGLKDVKVSKGEVLRKYDVIASSGTSVINSNLGNHLHFEINFKDKYIDPVKCLNKSIEECHE